MTNQPHIAVIILNWNGLDDTKECLESVFKNDYPNYSIYLIDNASARDELKELKTFCEKTIRPNRPTISFLQNKTNLGFAEGNNVGIRQALANGADYIFTLNNDTVVDKHFLSATIKYLEEEERDPSGKVGMKKKIGILATTMVNYYDRTRLDNTGHDLLTTGDTVPRDRNKETRKQGNKESNFAMRNHPGFLVSSFPRSHPMGSCAGASLYSSSMLRDIGLFDPDFFLNYEDSDLSLRGIVQGWQCTYCPDSIVYHKLNVSIGKIKDLPDRQAGSKYRIRSQRNQLWAYLHNAPLPVIILNLPWILLRDLLVILISFITFRWTITCIFLRSRLEILLTLPKILKKRRRIMKHKKISSLWFWKQQKSWISTYWRYFQEIIIKRQGSVMEKQ